ncbi:MAG: hypothetical protein ACRENE_23325 [Polyangiaceae bacterium]
MHRTQILLGEALYERALGVARARRSSLGELVREGLELRLARETEVDPIFEKLTRNPYDDPTPDVHLSHDVDHALYGAPRRARRRSRRT